MTARGRTRKTPPAEWRRALQPGRHAARVRDHLHGVRREVDGDRSNPATCGASGLISRFGTLDSSDGGETHRYTLSAEIQRSGTASTTKVLGYAMDYGLDLFSNFTYALNDPVNGDQFEQVDNRRVFGARVSHRRRSRLFDRSSTASACSCATTGSAPGFVCHATAAAPVGRRARIGSSDLDGRLLSRRAGAHRQVRVTAGLRGDLYDSTCAATGPRTQGPRCRLVSPKFGVVFAPDNESSCTATSATASTATMPGERQSPSTPRPAARQTGLHRWCARAAASSGCVR